MPTGLTAADRKLLAIGGSILVLMLAGISILTPPNDSFPSPVPSTYSAQSGGAKAAYELLTNLKYPVRRWESPPTELHGDENALVILAGPTQPPSKGERQALENFVKHGGRVLFTGANIKDYFTDAEVSRIPADPKFETLSPVLPSRVARNARKIVMQPRAHWGAMTADQLSLYGASDASAVVSWRKGDGEILWWAASTPLTNAGITREDNLQFFLNSVAGPENKERAGPSGAKAQSSPGLKVGAEAPTSVAPTYETARIEPNGGYRIYWDEYFHGQRSSVWSYVAKTSVAWSVLQFATLGLAVLFTFSRRSGPTFVPVETSRLSPLEFVDTLGGLYERAGAAALAVSVSYSRLRTLLTRQLSLPSNIRNAELATAAEQRLGWKDSGLGDALERAAGAVTKAQFPSGDALKIVQELEQFADKLKVRGSFQREKG